MTEKILIALLAGFILWAVKSVVSHLVKRARFREAILVDIQAHISGAKEQTGAAKVLVEETIQEGEEVPFPVVYTIDSYSYYSAVQKELPLYLNQDELVKVIKFYQAIWQLDVSVHALATAVGIWERDKVVISEQKLSHLKKRLSRISSFCDCITEKEINKINNLPSDYRQVKDAETVVENA